MNVGQFAAKIRHRAEELRRVSRAELIYIRERACSMDTVSTHSLESGWMGMCDLAAAASTLLTSVTTASQLAGRGGGGQHW